MIQVSVRSNDGQNLGKVQDLIVNPNTGQIESALVSKGFVIDHGSVASLGEIVIPIPWRAVAVGAERQFVLDVDEQKLEADPGGSDKDSDQPGYAVHILGMFQLHPPLGLGGPGEGEVESGHGEGGSESPVKEGSAGSPDEL